MGDPAGFRQGDEMKEKYIRAMDVLYIACVIGAGTCLIVITLIIPYGVFCRYVLNSAAS